MDNTDDDKLLELQCKYQQMLQLSKEVDILKEQLTYDSYNTWDIGFEYKTLTIISFYNTIFCQCFPLPVNKKYFLFQNIEKIINLFDTTGDLPDKNIAEKICIYKQPEEKTGDEIVLWISKNTDKPHSYTLRQYIENNEAYRTFDYTIYKNNLYKILTKLMCWDSITSLPNLPFTRPSCPLTFPR